MSIKNQKKLPNIYGKTLGDHSKGKANIIKISNTINKIVYRDKIDIDPKDLSVGILYANSKQVPPFKI